MKHFAKILFSVSFVCTLFITGCTAQTPTQTATASPFATDETPLPGTNKNPIKIGFIVADPDSIPKDKIDKISEYLSSASGYTIKLQSYGTSQKLISSLTNQQIHAAWLQPAAYIYAHNKGLVTVNFLSNHFGSYLYGTQFLANQDDGFTPFFDPNLNANTAEPIDALSQFADKTPCIIEKTSLSGFVVPLGMLHRNRISTQPFVTLLTPTAVIRALYIKGICDFGVTYTYIGDPRTSNTVIGDLADAMTRIQVIYKSDPVIPMLNFSLSNNLPKEIAESINLAMGDLAKSEDGNQLLSDVLGYEIEDLKVVDDSIYDPLRDLIDNSGVPITDMLGW